MCAETKSFLNKFYIDVSSLLMSSIRAIVISQKYFGNRVISSQIHLFAPLLNMRRCTLCNDESHSVLHMTENLSRDKNVLADFYYHEVALRRVPVTRSISCSSNVH